LYAALFGISFGWYYPCSNGFFVSLVPEEKVTELWGFNAFCSVILSWVPPIIFAALNESTGNLRVGWIGVIIFEVTGFLIASTIPARNADSSGGDVDEKEMKKCESA
jgi:MFS-type transporter involved in bile tolerance (Atg22 family)